MGDFDFFGGTGGLFDEVISGPPCQLFLILFYYFQGMKYRRLSDLDHKVYRTAIGTAFKKLRLKAGKTILDISLAVDIQQHILDQLERGEYDLELGEYIDMCEYYDITPSAFMEQLEID